MNNTNVELEEKTIVEDDVITTASVSQDDDNILVVKNLKQYFPIEKNFFGVPTRYLRAVDGVSFSIKRGHTFGLVGESGCGKTTLGRTIIGLYNATDGEAVFNGQSILAYNKSEKARFEKFEDNYLRNKAFEAFKEENPELFYSKAEYASKFNVDDSELDNAYKTYKAESKIKIDAKKAEFKENISYPRSEVTFLKTKEKRALKTHLQMIFQDPYSSLSPRMTVGEIISEAVREHKLVPKSELKDYTFKIMKECGLQPYYYQRYPHEFSGGQRQRIGIARSLALNPELVICDEPVSALDVSIQAQIINLLMDLQKKNGLSYLFISHDLSVVEHISDDVGVMYLGNLVEKGTKEQIFNNPSHPYTLALLSAIPVPDPDYKTERIKLKGELPSPANPPKGCKFHTRCDKCMNICTKVQPEEIEIEDGHFVTCHLFDKLKAELEKEEGNTDYLPFVNETTKEDDSKEVSLDELESEVESQNDTTDNVSEEN